jgi:hypothetical protein
MGLDGRRAGESHLKFTFLLVGVAVCLVLLGYLPTRRLGGASAIQAMWYGCALNVLSASIGALPITFARIQPRRESAARVSLVSMVLRMGTALILAVAALIGLGLETKPFVLWFALAYAALLPIDTLYATKLSRAITEDNDR